MPLDLFQNRASRPIKRPRNRPDAPAIKQSQLNGRAINNRQPASRNCHPTTLNYPANRGVFALKLESADKYPRIADMADRAKAAASSLSDSGFRLIDGAVCEFL